MQVDSSTALGAPVLPSEPQGTISTNVGTSDLFVVVIDLNAHDWYTLEKEQCDNNANVGTTGTNTGSDGSNNKNEYRHRKPDSVSMTVSVSGGTGSGTDSATRNNLTFEDTIKSVLYFTTAMSFCWRHRRLTIIAVDGQNAVVVYDAIPTPATFDRKQLINKLLTQMNEFVQPNAHTAATDDTQATVRCDSKISFAIGAALCMISKRLLYAVEPRQGRILLLDVSPNDAYSGQYSSITKLSFAALKLGVPVDVCSLRHTSSPAALQQLAELSRGHRLEFQSSLRLQNYFQNCNATTAAGTNNKDDPAGAISGSHRYNISTAACATPGSFMEGALAQFLMFHFALPASPSASEGSAGAVGGSAGGQYGPFAGAPHGMATAASLSVEFGVVCVCHGRAVDLAKVCSCCLALYCVEGGSTLQICAFCKSDFHEG